MWDWIKSVFRHDVRPPITSIDVLSELHERAPILYGELFYKPPYERDCHLCRILGIDEPKPSDLIYVTELKIVEEMRRQDWRSPDMGAIEMTFDDKTKNDMDAIEQAKAALEAMIKRSEQGILPGLGETNAARLALSALSAIPAAEDCASVLTAQGVFKGAHGLQGLADAQEFWDQQPYGTRLYYGDGIADYLHRGVLRAAISALHPAPSASDRKDAEQKSVLDECLCNGDHQSCYRVRCNLGKQCAANKEKN